MRETDFDSEAYRYPRERVFKSDYQQFTWNRMLKNEEDIQLQVYRNNFRSPDVADVGFGIVDYSLASERLDFELQHRWQPASDWRVSWGGGARRDTVSGGVFDTTADMHREQVRAFGNVEWHATSDLVFNGGLMAEHYIEAQLTLRPAPGSLLHLAYAYAEAGGARLEYINSVFPVAPVPNDDKVPRHTFTVLASQALANDWALSGTYSYVSGMTWMGEGNEVKRFNRFDAKLAKRLRSPDGDWLLSLNVQNLFDDGHYEFEPADPTLPLPGNRAERRVMFQAEYLLK
jgi:outer membrane receptor protein involved in Fe transport